MGEEDKCEKSKLYLESFVFFQARDDAGLDWHDTDRPVRSVWIKNVLKIPQTLLPSRLPHNMEQSSL